MSNIYIQEPPTSGKVLLKTSVGDIDIEFWSRECPKACRNFIQLCMEGYYDGTIFHRVVKGFIVQGGDPNGDGTGGDSIYGSPFKDEFHSRLRYIRRGLVGMANSDKDDNASQFFFTMAATPELQNKNTLFAKVTGDTVYNMLKLEEVTVDHNEKPMYPHKIIKTVILNNPFDDIIPREIKVKKKKDKSKIKEKGVKNFGLLSFGAEAEDDEFETDTFVKENIAGKSKSTHDILDDPMLSKEVLKTDKTKKIPSDLEEEAEEAEEGDDQLIVEANRKESVQEEAERIRNKLKSNKTKPPSTTTTATISKNLIKEDSDSDNDYLHSIEDEKKLSRDNKAKEIRSEILSLKKSYKDDQKKRTAKLIEVTAATATAEDKTLLAKQEGNEIIQAYNEEKNKYTNLKEKVPKKGSSREDFTLELLNKFKNKLDSVREKVNNSTNDSNKDEDIETDIQTDDWLSHTLRFDNENPIVAKDASTKTDDWYDVYDPRNPLNKRKRDNSKKESSKKHRR